jgi:hypothetical protein
MAMPVPGSLAEPIQLIPLTKNVIDAFFGGINPRGLSSEIQPKYMIFSGHRRYQAFVEIQGEALEMMATSPKEAGKLIDAYTAIPANVSNEEPGTTSDLLLRTWAANENRQAPDIMAKSQAYLRIKAAVATEELARQLKKTPLDEEARAAKLAELKESIMRRRTGHGSNAQIGAIMGFTASTAARFENFSRFPEELQRLFVDMGIPEALVGLITPRVKAEELTYDDVILFLKSRTEEKSRTWDALNRDFKHVVKGGEVVRDGEPEDTKKKDKGTDPKKAEAATEQRQSNIAFIKDNNEYMDPVSTSGGIAVNIRAFFVELTGDIKLSSKDRELLEARLLRFVTVKAKVHIPDAGFDEMKRMLVTDEQA